MQDGRPPRVPVSSKCNPSFPLRSALDGSPVTGSRSLFFAGAAPRPARQGVMAAKENWSGGGVARFRAGEMYFPRGVKTS
jgi:hypothetical protein